LFFFKDSQDNMLPIKLSGKAFSTRNQGTKLHAGYLAFFAFWGINALKPWFTEKSYKAAKVLPGLQNNGE